MGIFRKTKKKEEAIQPVNTSIDVSDIEIPDIDIASELNRSISTVVANQKLKQKETFANSASVEFDPLSLLSWEETRNIDEINRYNRYKQNILNLVSKFNSSGLHAEVKDNRILLNGQELHYHHANMDEIGDYYYTADDKNKITKFYLPINAKPTNDARTFNKRLKPSLLAFHNLDNNFLNIPTGNGGKRTVSLREAQAMEARGEWKSNWYLPDSVLYRDQHANDIVVVDDDDFDPNKEFNFASSQDSLDRQNQSTSRQMENNRKADEAGKLVDDMFKTWFLGNIGLGGAIVTGFMPGVMLPTLGKTALDVVGSTALGEASAHGAKKLGLNENYQNLARLAGSSFGFGTGNLIKGTYNFGFKPAFKLFIYSGIENTPNFYLGNKAYDYVENSNLEDGFWKDVLALSAASMGAGYANSAKQATGAALTKLTNTNFGNNYYFNKAIDYILNKNLFTSALTSSLNVYTSGLQSVIRPEQFSSKYGLNIAKTINNYSSYMMNPVKQSVYHMPLNLTLSGVSLFTGNDNIVVNTLLSNLASKNMNSLAYYLKRKSGGNSGFMKVVNNMLKKDPNIYNGRMSNSAQNHYTDKSNGLGFVDLEFNRFVVPEGTRYVSPVRAGQNIIVRKNGVDVSRSLAAKLGTGDSRYGYGSLMGITQHTFNNEPLRLSAEFAGDFEINPGRKSLFIKTNNGFVVNPEAITRRTGFRNMENTVFKYDDNTHSNVAGFNGLYLRQNGKTFIFGIDTPGYQDVGKSYADVLGKLTRTLGLFLDQNSYHPYSISMVNVPKIGNFNSTIQTPASKLRIKSTDNMMIRSMKKRHNKGVLYGPNLYPRGGGGVNVNKLISAHNLRLQKNMYRSTLELRNLVKSFNTAFGTNYNIPGFRLTSFRPTSEQYQWFIDNNLVNSQGRPTITNWENYFSTH